MTNEALWSDVRRIVGRDIEEIGPLMRRTSGITIKISNFLALTRDVLEATFSPDAKVILVYCPEKYHFALGVRFDEVFQEISGFVTNARAGKKCMRLAGGPVLHFTAGTDRGHAVRGLAPNIFILVDPLAP